MNSDEVIEDLCQAFLTGIQSILGEKLFGVYLYGAVVFPETSSLGDIDFHVLMKDMLTREEKSALNVLHLSLSRDYPPLGAELDGYYIMLEDTKRMAPPRDQRLGDVNDDAWALHYAHIRSGKNIILYGPDPRHVYPEPTWLDLENALLSELAYVERNLHVFPGYCILNLCRLMYSFETHDVLISKVAAATWAGEKYPQWRPYIELALMSYEKLITIEERERMLSRVEEFFLFSCNRINQRRGEQYKIDLNWS